MLVGQFGSFYKYVYGIIIIGAIITTQISAIFGFLNNVTNDKKTYNKLNGLICVSSLFISIIGFSNLINIIYPSFGVLRNNSGIFYFKI